VSTVIPLRQSAVESSLKQAAFDHLALPTICFNASAQILTANGAAALLIGKPVDIVIGRHLAEVLAFPRYRDVTRRWVRFWDVIERDGRISGHAKIPLADGRRVAIQFDAELLRFEQETVAAVTLMDIGERREVERARRRDLARAAAIAQASGEIGILIGADRRVISISAAALTATGVNSGDAIGVPFEYLLDDAAAAEFARAVERMSAQDDTVPLRFEWRLRLSGQGGGRWMLGTLTNRLRDPMVQAFVICARDVTEARETKRRMRLLERRLRSFAEHAADALMVLDGEGVIRYQSAAIQKSLGVKSDATIGKPGVSLVVEEDQLALREAIDAAARDSSSRRTHSCLVRFAHADGNLRRLWISARNLMSDATIGGLLLTARDVTGAALARGTEAGRQARRLEYRERLLELAIHTRADFAHCLSRALRVIAETLRAGSASFWVHESSPPALRCESCFDARNDRFVREWVGTEFPAAVYAEYFGHLHDRQPVVVADIGTSLMLAPLAADPRWAGLKATLDAPVLLDGDVRGVLRVQNAEARSWDEDEINFVTTGALLIALAMEASQRQEAETRIEQLAWYDSLTGLPNRNLLRETMRDMIMTAANRRRRIAVMLIDLDRFKDVNDTLGHLVGDALIKSAAQIIKDIVAERGMVARLGGDEFVVVLNDFEHRQEVALVAARIAQSLHRTDLVPNVDTQVSASIGIALFPEHGREMSTLLKNADAGMYQAKRDGRNQFSFFNPIRYETAAREVQLGIQMLKALQSEQPQFVLEYQPQVQMDTGRVVGLEALIRWQHPTYGRLTPDRFISVAEVSGLSERITRWLVNDVCAQIVRWREKQPSFDIPISVNVAGREMGSASLPIIVRSALAKHGIEPHMITLEITERTLVRESEVNNDVLNELAALGVGLVLDDFGTGYSMLAYLKRMPIKALKIDQSFVEGVPNDADSCAIVHAMLAVARHFRLKVVAEGIETPEQVEYLRNIGCEFAQGFYYSRALPPQTILEYIEFGPGDAAAH
jgi:diguanylate cyclase (GGDEF)-like protein/PAS domain S-box-containing protein